VLNLKKGYAARDFNRWWNQFLTGDFSLKCKARGRKQVKEVELDEGKFSKINLLKLI
jgi:hypothetical protein